MMVTFKPRETRLNKRLSEGSPRVTLVLYLDESFHPDLHSGARLCSAAGFWAGGRCWYLGFASWARSTLCLASLDKTECSPPHTLLPEQEVLKKSHYLPWPGGHHVQLDPSLQHRLDLLSAAVPPHREHLHAVLSL